MMRRDDTNVAKQVTMMKVGGKRSRGRPRLRWMDRVRSNMNEKQLDPKLAQNGEAWRKAVMVIDPDRDKIGHSEQPGQLNSASITSL